MGMNILCCGFSGQLAHSFNLLPLLQYAAMAKLSRQTGQEYSYRGTNSGVFWGSSNHAGLHIQRGHGQN